MDDITTPTMLIVDVEAGTEVIRDYTPEEIAEREQIALEQAQKDAEAQAKVEARERALDKLAALGLTQDEIEAL